MATPINVLQFSWVHCHKGRSVQINFFLNQLKKKSFKKRKCLVTTRMTSLEVLILYLCLPLQKSHNCPCGSAPSSGGEQSAFDDSLSPCVLMLLHVPGRAASSSFPHAWPQAAAPAAGGDAATIRDHISHRFLVSMVSKWLKASLVCRVARHQRNVRVLQVLF